MRIFAPVLFALAACHPTPAPARDAADLVLVGGDIRTMDPAHPKASAVAIENGKILAVGDDAEIRKLAGAGTEIIELGGRTVTPGLVDAHCHLYGLGNDLENVSVRGQSSEADVVKIVVDAAKTRPAGEWLIGRGWDQNRWPGQQFPTKATLDAITDRPVMLKRIDGHAIWVNTVGLAAAGIDATTKDPAGGKILRDASGGPTGVFVDNATDLVEAKIPEATADMRRRRIEKALAKAIESGITGVHEMGIDEATAAVYRAMDGEGDGLPLRVYAYMSGDASKPARFATAPLPSTKHFAMRGVKFFADGALGSRGARLYADYDDDKGNRGLWVTEPAQLEVAVGAAVAGGWQVAIHAIGDAAIGAVLDAFLAANAAHPGDHRLRVEHTQVIAPDDIAKMVSAKAIASMQPTHATSDMPWAEARIGHARIAGAYAWRTLMDRGIPLASGSDFPVEDVGPLLGIYASISRQDASGKPDGGWYPEQRMTLDEAIAGFTRGAAYAEFADDTRGVIAVGKTADLTVLDRAIAADRTILETRADYTILDGAIRYRRLSRGDAAK